jgi:PAS domain S-box-containing protein
VQLAPEPDIDELRRRVAELEQALSARSDLPAAGASPHPEADRALDLLKSIGDSVAALDRDWRYTYVNKCAEEMAGISQEKLLGSVFWDVFPELTATPTYEHLQSTMRERVHTRFERLDAPHTLWVEVDAYPAAEGLVMIVRDITARKQTERRLSESEEWARNKFAELESYYETAPVGLAFVDCELRYRRINQRLSAINGLPMERHIGLTIREVRPEVADAVVPLLLEVIRTGEPILDREIPGAGRFYRSSYYPVQSDSQIVGVSIVVQDVTAQTGIEIALRRSEERLQLAVDVHRIGIFDWDIDTGRVVWNEQEYQLFGLTREQFDGTVDGSLRYLLPEDLDNVTAALQECLAAARPSVTLEFRIRRPDGELRWIQAHDRILYDPEGRAYRVVGVNIDVTHQRASEEALKRSEERYRMLFENTRDGILIVDDQGRYVDVNQSYCRILKATRSRLIGAHFSEFIPPERVQEAEQAFVALRNGATTPVDFPLRALDGTIVELAWTSSSNYLPGFYFCACRDITERKRSEAALRHSEYQLRVVLDTAPAFIAYVGTDCRYVRVNRAYEEWFGLPAAEIAGKHIQEAFGEDYFRNFAPLLQKVLAGEIVAFESPAVRPNGERHEMSVTYTPDRDDSGAVRGFIALLQNITERRRNEAALQLREEELKRLLAALPEVISRFDRSLRILYTNPAIERFTGLPPEYFAGKTHLEAGMPSAVAKRLDDSLMRIFETGQPETMEFDLRFPRLGLRHLVGTGMVETVTDGRVSTVLTIIRDVTGQTVAERERNLLLVREQEARETAELLNRVGPMLLGELDPQKLGQSITDIATRLVGAEFGSLFHNVIKESGEAYMLYTLSGVPREAFAGFPMPRNTDVFAPTFRGEGVVRSEDITQDPRYGHNSPHYGMPKGHLPVRSYLAAPVISRSGEVLGGLFFGHSDRARFTERHESLIVGIAAQAAIAMDNARLFEQSQWTQQELKRSNEKLRRANKDLETFAYSASHDLQEPLRNIAMSAQLLQRSFGKPFEGDSAKFFEGVLQGAVRMRTLVEDLLAYTRAFKYAEGPLPSVDAGAILAKVIESFQAPIDQSSATITFAELPVTSMLEAHLAQLFQNLIGNALKYRGEHPPRIHISAKGQDGWWVFSVADNGMGIDIRYSSQIFGLFKRLHTREEYPGTGIGLAICQRIVEQYGGRIWLEKSTLGEGSVFCFALPDRRSE